VDPGAGGGASAPARRGGAERRRDLLDGLRLGGAHVLAVLPVCGRDLVRQGDDEAPVVVDLPGRRLALEQRHRAAQVLQPVVPELFHRVVSRVVHRGLRRDDLVQQLARAVL
jgi:hypothetical protein